MMRMGTRGSRPTCSCPVIQSPICQAVRSAIFGVHYPDNGEVAAVEAFFPPLHGTRLVEFYLPPGATEYVDEQPQDSKMAEAAKLIEADRPGMHRTPTVDFVIVMEGRCDCELDQGKVTLSKGDVVVQNGTIHGWFNPYDEPCRFLAVMVGAKNDLCP